MSKLFDDDDSEAEVSLKTDTEFAKNYDKWRQKEELHKLQAKYGDDSSDSSSSSEDDEGEEIDDQFEKDFFKTLSCLKSKDPRIYDKNFEFFDKLEPNYHIKKKKEQPMYVKDYERKLLLEKGGQLSDEEDYVVKSSTYVEEQRELKENLKKVLNSVDDVNDDEGEDWGGMFKARQKTNEEKRKEEEQYLQWLGGQTENLKDEDAKDDLKPLKDYWNNPKLDAGEKFLRDYVLKKRFLESDDADYIPTYDEIVHDSDEGLSEDEKAVDNQEEFEHKYNFRFEEPDQEFIKRYPRTMENSLRQKDEKRKVKRLERKERKKLEKQQKLEEMHQLKTLKKKEIEEKIDKLKEITGNPDINIDINDLEGDFDPEEHDKRMQALFNDEFYDCPEGDQKPEFPDIDKELEIENWDHWHGNENESEAEENELHGPHCEDEDFIMDCDYDPVNTQKELIENSRSRKKRRRKSKFAKVVSQPKPVFDPKLKTYQEYLDEFYKLDCEDVIGDIPCRFKYREVVPNSFGLSIEEILTAPDKELNRWCSLKKAIQRRPEHVEKYDVVAFEKKGQNINLKRKYLPSLFTEEKTEGIAPSTSGSVSSNIDVHIDDTTDANDSSRNEGEPKKKRKRKVSRGQNSKTAVDVGISDARLTAYGINPKKFKNKLKYGNA